MTARTWPDPADPAVAFLKGWSLDMIAPLDESGEALGGDLLGRWGDLTIADLPPSAQTVALAWAPWRDILAALATPCALAEACDSFVAGLQRRLERKHDARVAAVSLTRAGLISDEVPTFAVLGRDMGVTAARAQQLDRPISGEAAAELGWRSPLRLVIAARFALAPGSPLEVGVLALPQTRVERALRLGLEAMSVPRLGIRPDLWVRTSVELRADTALAAELEGLLPRARSFGELEALVIERLPGVEEVIDLAETLRVLARTLDFGPGLDGRFATNYAALVERVARKVRTYLRRRGVSITPSELAEAIRRGVPPFEPFHRPLVGGEWLTECAIRSPHLLRLDAHGEIDLAEHLTTNHVGGNVAVLHSIVEENGEPMRMLDLCDRASQYGISRNQVGVFIHSGRAASLFMLDRGIVGLVGRDEHADPKQYKAATPHEVPQARIGKSIGLDADGNIAADIVVRRSVREQGFGLPWPLSIFYFSGRQRLRVDDEPRAVIFRANGELDLPELEPGSTVRVRLKVTGAGHRLLVETRADDRLEHLVEHPGVLVPPGLQSLADRPGWVDCALTGLGGRPQQLRDVQVRLPGEMTDRRRLRAIYAFIAIGLLEPRSEGWRAHPGRSLPAELTTVYRALRRDPSAYAVMSPSDRAAAAWLARATWLVPTLGWSLVYANDLTNHAVEGDADEVARPPVARETARMQIAEAAHGADDLRRFPGSSSEIEAAADVVRRYLTALGYTAYNAISPVAGATDRAFAVRLRGQNDVSSVWIIKPLGSVVDIAELERACELAKSLGAPTAVSTDALELIAESEGEILRVNMRRAAISADEFDKLCRLAAESAELAAG